MIERVLPWTSFSPNVVYTAGSNSFGQCGHHGNSEKELKLNPISGSLYKQVSYYLY